MTSTSTFTPTLSNDANESFTIDLDLDALTDDAAKTLLLDTHRLLLAAIIDDASHIQNDDFSDDDTDYFPARASIYAAIVGMLSETTSYFNDALRDALNQMHFCIDLITADIDLPISIRYAE